MMWRGGPARGPQILVAFAGAGVLTYGSVRYVQWRAKVREVPAVFGPGWRRAVVTGAVAGAVFAAVGIAYLQKVHGLGLLDEAADQSNMAAGTPVGVWVLALAVLVAPLFEEFIFRSLIFGGLRRSMRFLPAAVANSAVFAIAHPPLAMLKGYPFSSPPPISPNFEAPPNANTRHH